MNAKKLTPKLVRSLTLVAEPCLLCDDCFDLMDYYVDSLLADPAFDLPAMTSHLEGCLVCAEETLSLLDLVAADAGIDPDAARRRLPAV